MRCYGEISTIYSIPHVNIFCAAFFITQYFWINNETKHRKQISKNIQFPSIIHYFYKQHTVSSNEVLFCKYSTWKITRILATISFLQAFPTKITINKFNLRLIKSFEYCISLFDQTKQDISLSQQKKKILRFNIMKRGIS